MFDSVAPELSANDVLPERWPLLAEPAALPDLAAARVEDNRREVLVAVRGGAWMPAVVWRWAWTTSDARPAWSAQIEYDGRTAWYHWTSRAMLLPPQRRA